MSGTLSSSTGRRYEVQMVCEGWGVPRSTVYAARRRERHDAGVAHGLKVRHDHGSQYMSDALQRELVFFGSSLRRQSCGHPKGNGCADRFIRTP